MVHNRLCITQFRAWISQKCMKLLFNFRSFITMNQPLQRFRTLPYSDQFQKMLVKSLQKALQELILWNTIYDYNVTTDKWYNLLKDKKYSIQQQKCYMYWEKLAALLFKIKQKTKNLLCIKVDYFLKTLICMFIIIKITF
jgi:hypothetical protein